MEWEIEKHRVNRGLKVWMGRRNNHATQESAGFQGTAQESISSKGRSKGRSFISQTNATVSWISASISEC
jgi:hypothetical protein